MRGICINSSALIVNPLILSAIKIITTALVLLFAGILDVQGQLVNGSFENYVNLPVNLGEWQVVDGWNNAESTLASPDYYNYLANANCDIPQTAMALINAADGEGIMGMVMCGRKLSNIREYLVNEFSSALEVGKQYNFEFRISNGQRTNVSAAGLAVSKIGVYFSIEQPVQADYSPLNVVPQFTIDTVFYSPQWTTVSFAFTAAQPYKYMTLGVFGNDDDKLIEIREGNDPAYAYYFVDGFKLQPVSSTYNPQNPLPDRDDQATVKPENPKPPIVSGTIPQPFFIPNSFTPNNDGFNDVYKPVKGYISEWEFEIFSPWGEKVFATNDEDLGWDGFYNGAPCNVGSYVWQISYRVTDEHGEWRPVVDKGIFTLIR